MKKLLLAGVAVGALAMHSANAADLARKAPAYAPPPAAPVFSWTGCYVGANVGWGWGRNNITQTTTASSLAFGNIGSQKVTTGVDTDGAVFGGQVGCDWQFAPNWVIGIQGMLDGADINGLANDNANGLLGVGTGTMGVKTKWLGSVTGRLGWVYQPEAMAYIKGGAAWAGYQMDFHNLATNIVGLGTVPGIVNTTFNGWTIGGGLEWRFLSHWTGFVEYNYYQFGSKNVVNTSQFFSFNPFLDADDVTVHNSIDMKPRIQTVTVGVNYRFNGL